MHINSRKDECHESILDSITEQAQGGDRCWTALLHEEKINQKQTGPRIILEMLVCSIVAHKHDVRRGKSKC